MKSVPTILVMLIVAPVLALFGGAGILAWQIGETWTEATTAALVTGLVTVCGGGAVVMALILSMIVGIPMATRFFAEQGVARKAWGEGSPPVIVDYRVPPGRQLGYQEPRPPQFGNGDGGAWQSSGLDGYDLWDDVDDRDAWNRVERVRR